MAFRSPSTPSARRNARPVACTKLWVTRGALGRLVMMGALVGLGTPLECCSEGDSFWSDLDDPARTPSGAGSHAASQLPCLSRRRRCMVPHLCPAASFSGAGSCVMPTLGSASSSSATSSVGRRQVRVPARPPAGWLRGLRRRPQASPAACPAPALESRVWAACAGHLLWARGARYGMRSAFVSRQRSEHLATCPQKKMGEIEKLKSDKKEASVRKVFQNCLRIRS